MTLYWWSHWFWITAFYYVLILVPILLVYSYPSQDAAVDYHQNQPQTEKTILIKRYRLTTAMAWLTKWHNNGNNSKSLDVKAADTILRQSYNSISNVNKQSAQSNTNETTNNHQNESDESIAIPVEQYHDKRSAEEDDSIASTEAVFNVLEDATTEAVKSELNTSLSNSSQDRTSSTTTVTTTTMAATTSPSIRLIPTPVNGSQKIVSASEWLNAMTKRLHAAAAIASTPSTVASTSKSEEIQRLPFTLQNVHIEDDMQRAESEHRPRKSKGLSPDYKHLQHLINYSSESKSLLTRAASTAALNVNEFDNDEGNVSSEALSIRRSQFMDAGAISAICFTLFGVCCTIGTISLVFYRRRYLNKPQELSEPDSSVYIDDSTMRDNSDEMYSLDNDSFLNSLEAMTIQNYWTDTVKHTKL